MAASIFPRAYYEQHRKIVTLSNEVPVSPEEPVPEPVDVETLPQSVITHLDAKIWLPFAAKTYHISPRIEDYVLVPTPICPSDLPNRNGIGFPKGELVKFQAPPISRQVFKAWKGCPVHLEHDNEDCTKAYGVVFDTAFTRIKGYGNGQFWKVMGLAAIDKNKHPDIAQDFLERRRNTFSMGTTAESFSCSICNAPATDNIFSNCAHIKTTKEVNWKPFVGADGVTRVAYLNAHDLSPIELSIVADPAWAPALSDHILADGLEAPSIPNKD